MLVFMKLAADFSRGCAGQRIGHLLFTTHPTIMASANGPTRAVAVCHDDSHHGGYAFAAQCLLTRKRLQDGDRLFSNSIEVESSSLSYMHFQERPSPDLHESELYFPRDMLRKLRTSRCRPYATRYEVRNGGISQDGRRRPSCKCTCCCT